MLPVTWLEVVSHTRSRRSFRSGKRRSLPLAVATIERLEERSLLTTAVVVPLDPTLDQIGFQPVVVQAFDDPSTPEQEAWVAFGIFDTGASVVTLSVNDSFFFEPSFPIKVPGGAVAEGIGGILTGDVSQPVSVLLDGLDAATLEFEEIIPGVLFPNFTFDLASAINTPGVQVFVGTLSDGTNAGSEELPTIAGTPTLNPSPTNPNGLAVLFSPEGEVLDLSDFAEGLVLPVPSVDFVQPDTQLTASAQVSDTGTVSGVAATTTSFAGDAALFDIDDIYVGFTLRFVGGALNGQSRVIADYDGATRTFTFADGFSSAPTSGAAFEIVRFSSAPVEIDLDFIGEEYANYTSPGNDPTIAANPVCNGVALSQNGLTVTDKSFLFDTGAMLSTISTDMAIALGLDLALPDGMLDIGGAGGVVASIPGYVIDEFTVPTSDGGTLTFTDVWVFVLDVSSEFDGIWGMNMFNPAAEILYDPFDPDGTPSLQITFFEDRIQQPLPPLEDGELQLLQSLPFAGAVGLGGIPTLPGFEVAAAAPQVTGIQFGYGTDQWIDAAALSGRTAPWTITRIAITFDQDVLVDLNDLAVSGSFGGLYAFSAFSYNAATRTAVWTLATPIQADRLTIALDGDDASADGNDGVSAGGSYLSTGDTTTSLDVLFGDVNGDGVVNLLDALLQRGRNGTSDPWADINGDGVVNLLDALLLRGRNGASLN